MKMFRGERFEIDLGSDDASGYAANTALPGAFVNDVLERPTAPQPPTAPTLKNKTGFPEHGSRRAESRFKQRLSAQRPVESMDPPSVSAPESPRNGSTLQTAPSSEKVTWEEEEKARIDRENNERLADMSNAEIEQERKELMNSLSPEMIQKLLQRSSIESGSAEADLMRQREPVPGSSMKQANAMNDRVDKKVAFAEPPPTVDDQLEDATGLEDPDDNEAQPSGTEPLPADDSIHFPQPSQPPELDPSSANFLTDLHTKYFPSLPSDPEKLEWMQPTKASNSYDPAASALEPKDLRFSFKGALIPPSTATSIPVTAGLHHHGDAPEAAGYTIPELSHLARSTYPAQRCIAFQTLGRILFRLGKGEFGDAAAEDGGLSVLARGLWREMGKEKVTEMLVRESEGKGVGGGRHVSAKAYATEAVWLWQRGGGRIMGAE